MTDRPTLEERQTEEYQRTHKLTDGRSLIEPTDEERRNGWTAESLTEYVRDQEAAQELRADPNSLFRRGQKRPMQANSRYSPFKWRK